MDVTLVPLGRSHLGLLQELVADPLVLRFTRIPNPPPAGFASTWLAAYEQGKADGTREGFAVVVDGNPAGIGVVVDINRDTSTLELGYVVAAHARGRGIATATLRELTRWVVETLDPERIELVIGVDNVASSRVAARSGYSLEGVLRNRYVKPGLREDTQIWSLVRSDRR
ncbi:MAG: GNAT family N-acetyltransferase [Gaiellales bacterium]